MIIKPIEFGSNKAGLLEQLGTYSSVPAAYKEYTSNAVDSRIISQPLTVNVLVHRKGRLIVEDNGMGMSESMVDRIPDHVSESIKKGDPSKIGEKAIGLFAYHTFASSLGLYTREEDAPNGVTYYLMHKRGMQGMGLDKMNGNIPYGPMARGTRVVIEDFLPTKKNAIKPEAIYDALAEMYDPLLKTSEMTVNVGYAGDQTRKIVPIIYVGTKIEIDPIEIDFRDESGRKKGRIEFNIYLDPEGADKRVKLYNRGVKVFNSMSHRREFENKTWRSGRLLGYVNDDFLHLLMHRSDVDANEAFDRYVEAIRDEVEPILEKELGQTRSKRKKDDAAKFGDFFIRALGDIFKEIAPQFGIDLAGTTAPKPNPDPNPEPGDPRGPRGPYGPRPPHGKLPEYSFLPSEFDQNEMHMRIKVDHDMKRIIANSSHPDWKRLEDRSTADLNRYEAFLISQGMGQVLFKVFNESGKMTPEESQKKITDAQTEFYMRGLRAVGLAEKDKE